MRSILFALLMLCPAAALCQGVEGIHDLRVRAFELADENKLDEAYKVQRDAVLIARGQGRPELQAQCLLELASMDWDMSEDADFERPLRALQAARTIAIMTGRLDLEARLVDARFFQGDFDVTDVDQLDAAIVLNDIHNFEILWNQLRGDEETEELAANGLQVLDLMAEARLVARGLNNADAAVRLAVAAGKIGKLGFKLCTIALLEEAFALEPSLIEVMQPMYEQRGDIRGLTLAAIISAPLKPDDEKREEVISTLEAAYKTAIELRNTGLQIRAAEKLSKLTGDKYWSDAVRLIRQAELFELIADGRRALDNPFFMDASLLGRLRQRSDDAEVSEILDLMTAPRQPQKDIKAFQAAFKTAIADEKNMRWAITIAELANRTEAFSVIVDALKADKANPFEFSAALEVLATVDDRATLIKLLAHKDPLVAEAAAAALFRLGIDGFEDAIRAEVARLKESNPPHRLYLQGALARLGDKASLDAVVAAASDEKIEYAAFGNGIMASLGYGKPMDSTLTLIVQNNSSMHLLRALGRMPNTWGQSNSTAWKRGKGDYQAARMWGLRTVPDRFTFANWKDPYALIWTMPRAADTDYYREALKFHEEIPKVEDATARKMLAWAAEREGIRANSMNAPATEPEEGETALTPLDDLVETERATRPMPQAENERRLTLFDWHSRGQWAMCKIRARTGSAVLTNATNIQIPFKWKFKRHCVSGGILGVLYRDVILRIAETDLLDKLEILLPGYEPINATTSAGENGWSNINAELPMILGEGLGDDRPIPLEVIQQGKLRITFNFNGNHGSVEFPIRVDAPPDAEKPDLVPLQLSLDPAVPEIGESARIFLRVKNNGKSVERDAISSVRFQVHNPQSEQGWHTLDAQVFVANGWRAGEIRTYEVRPKFIDGYFMNQYSYTYTPAIGDSKLVAVVDPDNVIEELDETNNQIELEVPLRRSREEGVKLAEAEALAALAQPTEDFTAADTIEKLDTAYDQVIDIISALKEQTPAVRQMAITLSEVYWFRRSQLRAKAAMAELEAAKAEGTLTRDKARHLRNELLRSQREVMNSGTPIKIESLERARNITLAAANIPASVGDMDNLLYATNVTDTDESVAGDAARTMKAFDAAMLVYIEARRARETGRVDQGNVMDAIANTADTLDLKLPGFSNFQRAIFQAELEYVDQGMRKEADAIQCLSDVIEGKEGAQERLTAAAQDVEKHIKEGPFTDKSIKNIMRGWVKDIPVFGPLADMIFSWK